MVQLISEQARLDEIFRLRVVAWATENVSFPDAHDGSVSDPADTGAEHYGIVVDGRVVAAARLSYHSAAYNLPVPDGAWYSKFDYSVALLSRLVVHPDSRRRGYGSWLTRHVASQAKRSAARTHVAYVSPAPSVFRDLSAAGFSSIGDAMLPWGDRAIDTRIMVRSGTANQAP